LLSERKVLIRNGGNMLASRTPKQTTLLRKTIAETLNATITSDNDADGADRFLMMPREDGEEDVIVLRPVAGRQGLEGNRAVLVILPQNDTLSMAGQLVQLHGLIPSEARFINAIIQYGTPADAAACIGITGQTAKTYMKRIYAKLGINSQLELGLLLGSLAPPLSNRRKPVASEHQITAFS
jgi:DNA-binding CsgD family transcriptional regulator